MKKQRLNENDREALAKYGLCEIGLKRAERHMKLLSKERMKEEMKEKMKGKMTIADVIAVSVNVSLKESITGDEIVDILHSGILPRNRVSHIGILFAEVHPIRLSKLFSTYNVTFEEAQKLYSNTPDFYHNSIMEAFLYGHMGKTS